MKTRIAIAAVILLILLAGCTAKKAEVPDTTAPPEEKALPLEIARGMKYTYVIEGSGGGREAVHLFVTGESDSEWEGVIARPEHPSPRFVRFEVTKDGSTLVFSEELERADMEGDVPLEPRVQFSPTLYPLLIPYIQGQYGISIDELSEWAVTLDGKEGAHPMALSLAGRTAKDGYEVIELKMQVSGTEEGVRVYSSTSVPHLLVEAGFEGGSLDGTRIGLLGVQEEEFSLGDFPDESELREAELEGQVKQLQEELSSKEEELEALREEMERLQQEAKQEVEEEVETKDLVIISLLSYSRYAECTLTYTVEQCARVDISIENTGSAAVDFNPLQNSWLEDGKGVQYNVVNSKDRLQYSGTKVYPNSKRRGLLYFQPAIPADVESLTLYVVVDQQVLNRTIF